MSTKKIIFLILILVLGIQVIFFAWWMLNDSSFKDLFSRTSQTEEVVQNNIRNHEEDNRAFSENIEGVNDAVKEMLKNVPASLSQELQSSRLYFMLRNKGGFTVRTFAFENNEFVESTSEALVDHFYAASPSQNKLAFLAIPNDSRNSIDQFDNKHVYEFKDAQIYIADAATGQSGAFPSLQASSKVSESDLPFKQYLSVSDEGKVLFNAGGLPDHDDHGVGDASDTSIYLSHNGATEFVANGFMPQWINPQEFIFFKNDGIYKMTAGQTEETLVKAAPVGVNVEINNRLDVTSDGKRIAWMQPRAQQLTILQFNDAEQKYEEYMSVSLKGYWAEFSPSGNYIAVQTTDPSRSGDEHSTDAKITFYDLQTQKKVPNFEISLDMFDQLSMFMNEWVKK